MSRWFSWLSENIEGESERHTRAAGAVAADFIEGRSIDPTKMGTALQTAQKSCHLSEGPLNRDGERHTDILGLGVARQGALTHIHQLDLGFCFELVEILEIHGKLPGLHHAAL